MWGHKQPKVLMVEDDQHNHQLFNDAFSKAGFTVTVLPNADGDFIEQVLTTAPDLISLDLMIGSAETVIERDGFDALGLLKADARTKKIPVIILTNFFEENKVELAKELGAVDFISLQSQSITSIANQFKSYIEKPKHYKPSHPLFRTS